jgi:DNA-directed RNA polymerase specialized sigma24 family protein
MTDLDALSDSPRAQTRVGVHVSLPEAGGGAATRFDRVFGDHRWRWPVLDVVAPAMDLETFLAACDDRDRKIVAMKFEGHQQIAIAAELGVSPAAVCLRLRAMRRRWDAQAVA